MSHIKYTVLITGTNRGLGLEFVKQFAIEGYQVIACTRKINKKDELHQLQKKFKTISICKLDIANFSSIDQFAKLFKKPIDILINNAGVYPDSSVDHVDYKSWLDAFKINTLAAFKMTKAFLPHLKKGQLKKIASLTSKMGSIDDNSGGGEYIYRSSKTALNMVMKSLSIDLKPYDLSVITLHPGWVRTDMGGPNGLIDVDESVAGMKRQIDKLTIRTSGQFIAYDGKKISW
ncbi:SDR family oxidoreductase [Candidatus Methylopumilus rimovensis]|jgi:NAD(P)-dependent dehydrogenase (short-subunit alcohol dehydrogenase family)|uniref:SDR family oxidoreductase n=1 Tax=Candidatus Methylopumilus rimovensis TaxID=2588535 RepID=A0AAE6FS05_9PROT|nr:SDR family oxidoreductase [Candidatus Methylopumilus rimovensis]QDD13085.1 SDR family oxidoreductase [Candidatus Methylopumilus rimovensis]